MQRFFIYAGIAAFLALYTLTLSTNQNSSLSMSFWVLFVFCALLALTMFGIITHYIIRIVREKHRRVFGSQIARKLSAMFATVALIPSLCIMMVSLQMITHNIDSWFNENTQEALDRGLQLSQSALNQSVAQIADEANRIRTDITTLYQQQQDIAPALLTAHAKQFDQLVVWNLSSRRIVKQRNPHQLHTPELDQTTIAYLLKDGVVRRPEHLNNHLYARGWLLLPQHNGAAHALFFRQAVPEDIARNTQLIEDARSQYKEVVHAQKGLQTFFVITLVIAALMSILLALAGSLYFAQRFVEPILQLANGARHVAQGEFNQRLTIIRNDEFGRLSNLFNHMTEQLAIAKQADTQHRNELEASHQFLERVLDSLSAGVITLDAEGRLNTYNRSAEAIVDLPLGDLVGQHRRDWKHRSAQHNVLADTLRTLLATAKSGEAAEISYSGADETRILLGKAISLPPENGSGTVLVFDNITTLVLAQKEAAWGEVAKRLAHEIRNPLTPIQLSAERLAHKLRDKLDNKDEQILTKSTDTIIKQVAALKEMVEAFRNYARAPSLKMHTINLNQLVSEVLVLYESNPCTFDAELSTIPLLLKADTTAMRQVLHNLLKNAAEAAEAAPHPQVSICTYTDDTGNACLTIANNGKSFSKAMLQNAFEPYTTDKASGTGLGLSVVKKIVDDHKGKISLSNQDGGGACVYLKFTTETP
ncbi:sensor histidine kinase [Conchiformibius steedae]|uniref:histidine kinase n=1 Tax=Conchiformibius steedae TaxID=153493 RepID=A0A3P2A602_9NEIS|nr:PAS domain-containing sensor histidine kinase [Conchiformibius steedae]RRD90799.1 PAS domain-containing sensor histidine kinase [Conchiformibius steedae]